MNQSLPLVLGLLGAGAVGAVTATLLQSGPTSKADPTAPIERTVENNKTITTLAEEIKRLGRRLDMLESAPPASARQAVGEMPISISEEALEGSVAAAMARQPGGTAGVQTLVADTLEQIRAQEELDREAEREQRRLDGIQRRVDRLVEDLELYADQPTQVFEILNTESVKRDELRDAMRDGSATFEDMTALRDEIQTSLGQVLNSTQLEKYNASNRFGGGGRGGGGFGGGGFGGGGNGGGAPGGGL